MKKFIKNLIWKFGEAKFSSHAHPKKFDWKWREKGFNRIALVNYIVSKTGGLKSNYLEIGCDSNVLFDAVASLKKTGVDPISGGTHRMTSDDFFKENTEKFDAIFIDGLHEYSQVRRDALNALNAINEGGWIAFHDFLPSTWKEHHVPRISKVWTGDCWKLAVELSRATDIEFRIVKIDRGVGLMRKISQNYEVPDLSEELTNAEFERFVKEVDSLPICDFEEAVRLIG
jgi:hypothetical protein